MRPRIRSIKPDVHLDEDLWDLETETGLPIFRAYTALWSCADKEGRFEWRPRPLKTHCLPYWDGDFSRVLDALTTRDFIIRYEVGGKVYGCVRTFGLHQAVNNKESESVLPMPPGYVQVGGRYVKDSDALDACVTREPRVDVASATPANPTLEGSEWNGNGNGNGNGRGGEREGRMLDSEPARDSRADVVWLNRLCAEVTSWPGSLLDGDRQERTAKQLISMGYACAKDCGLEGRELIELVMRKWWTPKRMRIRGKPWIVMALQDWPETLYEVEQDEIRRQENAAKEATRAN